MQKPSKKHFAVAKCVLRYIKGTLDHGLFYKAGGDEGLWGYCDSDWGGCINDSKSTTRFVFFLNGSICSWLSKKQTIMALSSAEAEYVAMTKATSQLIWLKRLLSDLGVNIEKDVKVYCDNVSAMAIAKNPVFHDQTKYIQIKYHFICDAMKNGIVKFKFCGSENQLADMFTKALPKSKFTGHKKELGVQPGHWIKEDY